MNEIMCSRTDLNVNWQRSAISCINNKNSIFDILCQTKQTAYSELWKWSSMGNETVSWLLETFARFCFCKDWEHSRCDVWPPIMAPNLNRLIHGWLAWRLERYMQNMHINMQKKKKKNKKNMQKICQNCKIWNNMQKKYRHMQEIYSFPSLPVKARFCFVLTVWTDRLFGTNIACRRKLRRAGVQIYRVNTCSEPEFCSQIEHKKRQGHVSIQQASWIHLEDCLNWYRRIGQLEKWET